MPQIPAYERDPLLTRLDTQVVEAGEVGGRPWVVLADTILYPEGGGQPADHGTVGGVEVVDVQKGPSGPRHLLAGAAPSGQVTVDLDWARRFDHMQQHTAQHLLTAVAERLFGWRTTAFHLGERVSDIELDTPSIPADRLAALEEAVAVEIRACRPVRARRVSPEAYAAMEVRSRGLPEGHSGDVRLVEIEGVDVNTCGGTHCASTAELEALKLLDTEGLRGGTRLSWVAGGRLRRLHETHHRRAARLRELLGASDDEMVERVEGKLTQLKEAERAIRSLEEELVSATAATLIRGAERLVSAHWPARSLPFLQRVAREVTAAVPDRVIFLTSGEGTEGVFVLAGGGASGLDVATAGRRVADLLDGRGGGSGGIFQGRGSGMSRRDEAATALRDLLGAREP